MEALRESVRQASVGTEIEYLGTVVAAYTSGGKAVRIVASSEKNFRWFHTYVDGFAVNATWSAARAIVDAVKQYAPD